MADNSDAMTLPRSHQGFRQLLEVAPFGSRANVISPANQLPLPAYDFVERAVALLTVCHAGEPRMRAAMVVTGVSAERLVTVTHGLRHFHDGG